ncbi:DUF6114 domain-containing protein [Corynebacterium glyciniphilum]|uniref:DUF6114 domain-containing protein n=1 Tax=Corynebacterium glyciniphilum TaxID=1404244 RepID=UPI0011AB51D3|nr:DUF6114 domain-containing protein [Corynebacterium glyciniphilum]MDN5682395.1 DUF6114 domain-containing protein [Corynebacterium glyciniphilum]MDN6706424.1 DUF6114 domain-containing protein [Corynebacterium glyciniphilum]
MPDDSTTPSGVNGADGAEDSTETTRSIDAVDDSAPGATGADTDAATDSRSEKLEKQNRRFSRWRKGRPFGAGLLMMLAGIVIMAPAYLSFSVSNIQIQISTMGGVSTLVIGILLITCGLMCWFRGEGRILAGVAAIILSILALWQSNFGGFGIGLILGLIGGALALAWDPQSRQDAKAEKTEKKEAKKARKAEKAGKKSAPGAGTAKSVIAVLAAVTVGVGIQTPDARAQIPGLPDIQLPELQIPGQGNENNGEDGDGNTDGGQNGADNSPRLPNLPDLPEAPDLNLPQFRLPDGNELQDGLDNSLESLGVEIPGLNVAPPEPVANMRAPFGGTFTIKTDTAKMTPGMKLSYVTIDTMQGPKKAIRIDADQAVMENLRVQFPNSLGPDLLDDTKGATSTLTGNFHIFVQELTMTLELLGVDTMVPITINADWAPDDIAAELSKIGLGLPDLLSAETRVLDVNLETYHVMSDHMDFPHKDIGPWHEN